MTLNQLLGSLLGVFLVFCLVIHRPVRSEKENANDFLDTALRLMRNKYKDPMSPIPMKNRTIGIYERIGLINVIALVRLTDGHIYKIGSLKRVGNATMTVYPARSKGR